AASTTSPAARVAGDAGRISEGPPEFRTGPVIYRLPPSSPTSNFKPPWVRLPFSPPPAYGRARRWVPMRRACWAAGMVLALAGCSPAVQDRVREYNREGVLLYERGDFAGAREHFQAA